MIYHLTHSNDNLWYLTLGEKQKKTKHMNTKFYPFFKWSEQQELPVAVRVSHKIPAINFIMSVLSQLEVLQYDTSLFDQF